MTITTSEPNGQDTAPTASPVRYLVVGPRAAVEAWRREQELPRRDVIPVSSGNAARGLGGRRSLNVVILPEVSSMREKTINEISANLQVLERSGTLAAVLAGAGFRDEPVGQHGWTDHGYPCCGKALIVSRPRGDIGECGGAGGCKHCAQQRDQVHATRSAPSTDPIAIPCATHRTRHTLTPREAAVVIVVALAYVEEAHAAPEPFSTEPPPFSPDWLCVADMLHAARDGEGYYEHVTSLLGDDAIDYPDADQP